MPCGRCESRNSVAQKWLVLIINRKYSTIILFLCDFATKLIKLLIGNKEFGIPPLEPLSVKKLVIDAGNAPINLRQALKNVKVHDMISTSTIQRYR